MRAHTTFLKQHSLSWRRANAHALLNSVSEEWINKWAVDFVEKPDTVTNSLRNSQLGDPSVTRNFHPSSAAFSSSFEDFAKSLVITDDLNEDQCRAAREGVSLSTVRVTSVGPLVII